MTCTSVISSDGEIAIGLSDHSESPPVSTLTVMFIHNSTENGSRILHNPIANDSMTVTLKDLERGLYTDFAIKARNNAGSSLTYCQGMDVYHDPTGGR